MSIAELRLRPGGWLGSKAPKAPKTTKRSRTRWPQPAPTAARKGGARRVRQARQSRGLVLGVFLGAMFRVVCWTAGLLASLALLGAISLGLVHGYRALTGSEHFAVSGIDITGNRQLSHAELLSLTGVAVGKSILEVNLGEVNARLLRNPWVESVTVRRILPGGLSIHLVEREPFFWIQQDGILYYADRLGAPIVPVELGRFVSLPSLMIEGEAGMEQEAFQDWMRAVERMEYPFGFQEIAWVKLDRANHVRFYLEDRGMEVAKDLGDWREHGRLMNRVWEDLRVRGELDRVGRMAVMADKVWVQAKASR